MPSPVVQSRLRLVGENWSIFNVPKFFLFVPKGTQALAVFELPELIVCSGGNNIPSGIRDLLGGERDCEHVLLAQCGNGQAWEGTMGLTVPSANAVQEALSGYADHLLR